MIIGLDFDDTITKGSWPDVGPLKFGAKWVIKKMLQRHTVILWTCRQGHALERAKFFLKKHDITPPYINQNYPAQIREYGGDCRKLSCDWLIDDKATFIFWPFIYIKLLWRERRQ